MGNIKGQRQALSLHFGYCSFKLQRQINKSESSKISLIVGKNRENSYVLTLWLSVSIMMSLYFPVFCKNSLCAFSSVAESFFTIKFQTNEELQS